MTARTFSGVRYQSRDILFTFMVLKKNNIINAMREKRGQAVCLWQGKLNKGKGGANGISQNHGGAKIGLLAHKWI